MWGDDGSKGAKQINVYYVNISIKKILSQTTVSRVKNELSRSRQSLFICIFIDEEHAFYHFYSKTAPSSGLFITIIYEALETAYISTGLAGKEY